MAQQVDIIANIITKVDGAEAGINKLKSSLSKLKIPDGLDKNLTKSFANLDGIFERYRNQLNKGFKTKGDVTAFAKTGRELEAELSKVSHYMTELTGKKVDFKVNSEPIKQAEKELAKLIELQQKLTNTALNFKVDGAKGQSIQSLLEGIKKEAGNTKAGKAANAALANLQMGDVEGAKAKVEEVITAYKRLGDEKKKAEVAGSGLNISGAATAIKEQLGTATSGLQQVKTEADQAKVSLEQMQGKQLGEAANQANKLATDMLEVNSSMSQANKTAQDFANSSFRIANELDQLKSSTQYFFGLRNMLSLFKKGIDDAVQSVKELDKAMTDTAVVTDYSVSDMWNMLPKYTKIANELGATTQGAYETMTLYFQQGLDQQQAFEVGAETMKMARIAGLDYAETTDMMTAALRGFNMELNATSAKRVNDVYSELAAITASDTEELGTAMQRTASIAHSAGASFEGTTAFLAQAIETTREPAENIGTAMKTIIARFQEMKKNPLEISEVDGEEVDFNKIDAALKTIGVDLVDTNGQFRDFDKVMLDISSRWDTLSQSQQRYIATVAAGSRQQSRFIAMVSDYDRTMQLMEAANNSTGASDVQFGKTVDSLEFKLHKLHNAWQAFTMGIANNNMVKFAVDGVTSLLTNVNKLIDRLSGGIGPLKSFLSIITAFTGLKVAGKIANGLIGALGGLVDPKTSLFKGMVTGAKGMRQGANAAQAKAISDPIVAVLKQIYGKLNGNKGIEQNLHRGSWQDFKNAQERFRNNANKGTIEDTIGSLRGLDKAQINGILANNPAIENRLQKGLNQSIGKMNITEGTQKLVQKAIPGIFKAFKQSPNMSPDAFVKALRPNQIGYALVKSGEKEAGQEIINAYNQQTRKNVEAFMSEHGVKSWEEHKQRMNGKGSEGYRDALKDYLNQTNNINNLPLPEPTKWDKLGASVGAVGSVFGTAGQAVTSFGVALSNLGLEKVGNSIAALGTTLSTVGSTISNVGMSVVMLGNGIAEAGSASAFFAPLISALPYIAAALAIIGTIGAVAIKAAKETQAIKDSAEQVTKSFEETSKQTKENIATLQQYKSEMARLSQGVDQNGNNINLSTDDYDEYLKIVDEIAAMNPDIVRGYNAQGHAIIDNNTALQKTLDLQEQINKETTDKYLKQTSLEKLLAARNLSGSDYTKNTTFVGVKASRAENARAQFMYGDQNYGIHKADIEKQVIPLQKQVQKVAKELQESDLFKQDEKSVKSLLQSYGIDFDKLLEGEKESVDNFVQNQSSIQSQLSSAAEGLGIDFSDKFNSAFEDLSVDTDAFNASIEPIFKNLAARVSNNEGFKNIAPEIQTSIMSGLKEIAKQDISASEMISQSNDLITIFQKLGDKTGEYGEAIKLVEEEQAKFSDSLDEKAYSKGVQPAIDQLYKLRDAAAELHTTAGDAVVEFYDNQIAQIENFTKTGTARLGDALNTMAGQFAEAKGAYDEFSEAVKDNDFYTAADNMKKIFDEINTDADKAGLGSKKFWMGAEELLGAENIDGLSVDAVAKQLNTIKPLLQEGEDGFQAFWDLIDQHKDKLNELDGVTVGADGWLKKWPDDLSEMSKELGISEKLLAALIDKARQFAHIDLSDPTKVREAVASSDNKIEGLTGDKKNLYVKEDTIRASLREADYTTKSEQDHEIQRMQDEEQIITIGNPEDLSNKQVSAMKKDLKLGDLPGLIETFGKTGEYNKEEIQGLAERFGLFENQEAFDTAYEDWVEKSTDPTQYKQTDLLGQLNSNVSSIAAAVVSKRIQEGHLDKPTAEQSEYATYGQKGVADTLGQLFSKGKDGNGNYFQSDAAFERNKKAIEEQRDSYESYLQVLKEGQKNATGAEKEKFDAEIESYKKMIGYLNDWLEEGEQKYKERKQNENQEDDSSNKSEDKTTDNSKDESSDSTEKTDYKNAIIEFLGKIFHPESTEQRQQYNTGGQESNIDFSTGTPTEDPREAARQAAQEKFSAWIQGLKEGTTTPTEDPKVAAGETSRQRWSELWTSIKNAFTSDTPTEDPKTEASNKARENWSSIWTSIKNAFTNGGEVADPKTEAGEKARQTWSNIWNSVKNAFTNGGKGNDPKVEAGEKAKQTWNDIWDKVKKALSTNPEINIDTGGNKKGQENTEVNSTGTTKVTFTGEVANPEELKASLQTQIASILKSVTAQTQKLQTSVNATVNYKSGSQAKAKKQTATVDYKKGKQDKASAQSAAVNYTLGSQAAPRPKSTTVNYTLGSQANPKPKTVDISPHFVGSWSKTITLTPSKAEGMNNKISSKPMPQFGSAAKGRYGTVGPKNKGGLTLTGEEGFEIAWLPGESKSMILGANGPQLLNLPSDAVVYTHEQSKKIIKQKAIPAGSHRGESSNPAVKRKGGTGGGTGGTKGGTKGGTTAKRSAPKTQTAPSLTAETAALSNVIVWWENIARRAESIQRKADKNQKDYEKYLKNIQATLKTTGTAGKGNDFIKNTNAAIARYQEEFNRATAELKNMDQGTKAQQQSWKTADKNDNIYAARNAFYAEQGGAVQISYSTGSGKKKKTVNKIVGTAGYIKAQDGTYVIDQTKLNTIKNKEERKALADALNKEINDRISKRNKAEDDIKKAQEALEKFGEELYNTFFAWETELTKIWNLTQKIEEIQSRVSRTDALEGLFKAQLGTGTRVADNTIIQDILNNFTNKLQEQNDIVQNRQQLLAESQKSLSNTLLSLDAKNARDNIQTKLDSTSLSQTERLGYENLLTQLKKQIALEDKARSYTQITRRADGTIGIDFNTQQFEKDKLEGNISADNAKAIQDWVKKIEELNKNFSEQYESLINDVTEYQNNLEDLQSEWANYGQELTDIADDYEKQRIDKLKELSSSIKDALDDLIDSVKKKLDERRRLEDNTKKEQDIARKQQRLAALRADTSGGHQVEIAQLQQEIADAQQDYQRSLEDQLIDKLQQQGDEAAKQRDRQIELQEGIATSTNNIAKVNEWMADPEHYKEEIRTQYYANKDYDNVTEAEQTQIAQDFEDFYAGLVTNQTKQIELKNSIDGLNDVLELLRKTIEKQGITLETAKENGLSVNEAREQFSGASFKDIKETGGYTLKDFIASNRTVKNMRYAGFTAEELRKENYTAQQLREGGYTADQVAKGGYTIQQAKQGGYSTGELIKAYGTEEALKAGYSGQTIQNANKATIANIQKAINDNKDNKNVSQTDLAGVKTNIDINGKNAGGVIEGTVTTGGKYIYANSGSTLYGQAVDTNTGKPTGDVKKVSIGSLSTTHFKGNKKEATEALVYAIIHQAWGSKINKNFKALVSAAGIGRNQYQLQSKGHAWWASVGTDGLIYQNMTNGVATWNPATGKSSLVKYDKAKFLAVAKQNNGPSREYAQVLINKKAYTKDALQKLGVKQFATGGLANYTGPAWLDGTPSKPELVLNATDTKNFIALKDVLSRAMSSSSQVNNSYGGNATYEININVDHLNNDYDVDKVVERVKKKIVSDSGYRNVTQVRKFR